MLSVVAHAFNLNIWRRRQVDLCELKAIVDYKVKFQARQRYTVRPLVSKEKASAGQWWCMPLIPALWEAEAGAGGFLSLRPGLHSEF